MMESWMGLSRSPIWGQLAWRVDDPLERPHIKVQILTLPSRPPPLGSWKLGSPPADLAGLTEKSPACVCDVILYTSGIQIVSPWTVQFLLQPDTRSPLSAPQRKRIPNSAGRLQQIESSAKRWLSGTWYRYRLSRYM